MLMAVEGDRYRAVARREFKSAGNEDVGKLAQVIRCEYDGKTRLY